MARAAAGASQAVTASAAINEYGTEKRSEFIRVRKKEKGGLE
jgi:hypothetical protein